MSEDIVTPKPRSDLGVRTASGIVMMAVAIAAIVLGGIYFEIFIGAIALGVLWEWVRLVNGFASSMAKRIIWYLGGVIYIGLAALALLMLSAPFFGMIGAVLLIAGVIGTDIGAYFAGRTFGGPKIAPKISPSKTWSGLFGGMAGAGAMMTLVNYGYGMLAVNSWKGTLAYAPIQTAIGGIFVAVIAQAGDFFESWMKRRAGVKDSSNLIPGHGGLFDRADGLLAVSFCVGLTFLGAMVAG
jgi:phosphatidate cytidylyltransferase